MCVCGDASGEWRCEGGGDVWECGEEVTILPRQA